MPTLTLIRTGPEYSTYRRPDGTHVHLAPGFPRTYLRDYSNDVLREVWNEYPSFNAAGFIEYLRESLTEPDIADEIFVCEDCGYPSHWDDAHSVNGDATVCTECIDKYRECDRCEYTSRSNFECDQCGETLCDSCFDYHAEDHRTEYEYCECEAPDVSFTFAGVPNDVTSTVNLPAGYIDQSGMHRIMSLLRSEDRWNAIFILNELEPVWQTREGNFPKRLARTLHKRHNETLPDDVRAKVGNIAREFSQASDVTVAFTRDLNQSAADFCNSGSCWWSEESRSRCVFKENGGIGVRAFDADNEHVTGRAWVMPLRKRENGWEATSDTSAPDGYLVFNGYGELEGTAAGRVVAALTGQKVRRVSFYCDNAMYVNGSTAYLVTPDETDEDRVHLYLGINH